jgi:hypothetical protein
VGTYVLRIAGPLADGPLPHFPGPGDVDRVREFLACSPVLAHTGRLFSTHWAWQELLDEQLPAFLAAGQVAARPPSGGAFDALALVEQRPGDERLWIGVADARGADDGARHDALVDLARRIRAHAGQVGAEQAAVMLPPLPWLRHAFGEAGFAPGDWEGELWIFAREVGHDR